MEETGLDYATKKSKKPTPDLAAIPTSGSATGSIVRADPSPAMSPDNTARPCTPTAPEHTIHTATSTAQRPLVDPPTTPHAKPSGQAAAGSFSTPLKPSSSNIDPACTAPSQSLSHRSGGASKTLETQQANESNQVTMKSRGNIENLLKHELRGAAYLHKKFFKEFFGEAAVDVQVKTLEKALPMTPSLLEPVGEGNLIAYNNTNKRWTIHHKITGQMEEKEVYEPLTGVLNKVGRAAFEVYKTTHPNDTIRRNYVEFINHNLKNTKHDSPSDGTASPDLVQGTVDERSGRVHWGDVELIIECKSKATTALRNEAYMQLARYARATFAHQIYRLHVFGFSLCGSVVNFVRFDRSGMLHSPDLDLSKPKDAHMFIEHIITLLTLDSCQFGYDDRYSFDYSSNPPLTLFSFRKNPAQPVTEILCHRKCTCGRATCVTCLGEDVHKSIWRDENRPDEGATMSRLVNVFGFCQLKDHSDVDYSTRLRYPEELEWSHATTYFAPSSQRFKSETIKNGTVSRGIRVKSDIIMRRGTSLFKVQNPLHLVMAMHDALLAIMALTEVGKMHCDISAYNLLLIDPEKHYAEGDWFGKSTFEVKPDVWKRNARGELVEDPQNDDNERDTSQDESPRLKRVKELGRGPCCVLLDTEFMVDDERDEKDIHADRTGTPAFISAQLLASGKPVRRTFMHDVESLFWVMLWMVICQSQEEGRWKVNEHAKGLMKQFSNDDMATLFKDKETLIRDALDGRFSATILKLDNPWCQDLVWLLTDFAELLYYYLYHQVSSSLDPRQVPGQSFTQNPIKRSTRNAVRQLDAYHDQLLNQPHLTTFRDLFEMFDQHICFLKQPRTDYQVDMARL
ncbi:hypothetical protein BN14_09649 [Rhizoctonia solani AG-1 IB]|uniref:Fungal-type protein kinase domain-containing protein n=2 Tax=Thanatephorus cucumeris (strain AG1-IB / isolate 7/3/14) TaxID=1108050 RepID=M5C7W2_THACB|nr:hypothetical protein BN14_09649 [Rhizoctonia solani AG-1 IB]